MFLYKNQFLLIFSFLSIPIELWESTAAFFRQSAGYVFYREFCCQIYQLALQLHFTDPQCELKVQGSIFSQKFVM